MVNYTETKIYKNMEELIAKDNEQDREDNKLQHIEENKAVLLDKKAIQRTA